MPSEIALSDSVNIESSANSESSEASASDASAIENDMLGLNDGLLHSEVDWGSQKMWRQQQEEIKPRCIKFVGQRQRAFWGHFGVSAWGEKGAKTGILYEEGPTCNLSREEEEMCIKGFERNFRSL